MRCIFMVDIFRTLSCHGFDSRFQVNNFIQSLAETVGEAAAKGDPLCIQGGNTKKFLGREPLGKPCSISSYAGVTNYEPTELVITAKAGTKLVNIETTLAEAGPDNPQAIVPPIVASTPKPGGSNGSIWPASARVASIAMSVVPALAVMTSSVGS